MKTILEPEDIQAIACEVVKSICPLIDAITDQANDDLMTVSEAATFLKVSKEQIYQWVSNSRHGLGSMPYMKAGKQLRFSKTDLIAWMQSGQHS